MLPVREASVVTTSHLKGIRCRGTSAVKNKSQSQQTYSEKTLPSHFDPHVPVPLGVLVETLDPNLERGHIARRPRGMRGESVAGMPLIRDVLVPSFLPFKNEIEN